MAQLVSLTLIHWIVIYPVDSAIQLLNNWGLIDWRFDSPNQKHYLDLGGDASLEWNFRARFSDSDQTLGTLRSNNADGNENVA